MMKRYYFLKYYISMFFLLISVSWIFAQQEAVYVEWDQNTTKSNVIKGKAVINGETIEVTVNITSKPGNNYYGAKKTRKKEENNIASSVVQKEDRDFRNFKSPGVIHQKVVDASGISDLKYFFETDKYVKTGGFDIASQYPNILTFTFSKPIIIEEFFIGDVDVIFSKMHCESIFSWNKYNAQDDSFTLKGTDFFEMNFDSPVTNALLPVTLGEDRIHFGNPSEIGYMGTGTCNAKFKKSKALSSFTLEYRGSELDGICVNLYGQVSASASNGINYYAMKIKNACDEPAPQIQSPQTICKEGATVKDLLDAVNQIGIRWYDAPYKGDLLALSTPLESGKTYYASRVRTCESIERTPVVVNIGDLSKPFIANHVQEFCVSQSPTVKDLKAQGLIIKWYDSETANIEIPEGKSLIDGKTYWAAQANEFGCVSPERDTVFVKVMDPFVGSISGQSYICIGSTSKFSVDGDAGGVWASSDTSVATVDAQGVVTAVNKGSIIISYTLGNGECEQKATKEIFVLDKPEKVTFSIAEKPSCEKPTGSILITNKNGSYIYTVEPSEPNITVEAYTGIVKGFRPDTDYLIYANISGSDCKSEASQVVRFSSEGLLNTPILETIEEATCDKPQKKVKITNYNPTQDYEVEPSDGAIITSNVITLSAGASYILYAKTETCSSGGVLMEVKNVEGAPDKPILGGLVAPTCDTGEGSIKVTNYTKSQIVSFTLVDLTIGDSKMVTPTDDMTIEGLIAEHTYIVKVEKDGCSSVSDELIVPAMQGELSKPEIGNISQPTCGNKNAKVTIKNFDSSSNARYELINKITGEKSTLEVDDTGVATVIAIDTEAFYMIKLYKSKCESPMSGEFLVKPTVDSPDKPEGTVTVPISCLSDKATIEIVKQDGLEYSIDNINWQESNIFSELGAGEYRLYIRTRKNPDCVVQSGTLLEVKNAEGLPQKPNPKMVVRPSCENPRGSIEIVEQNGVEYSINGTTWQASNKFESVEGGKYSLYVRRVSDKSCEAVSLEKVDVTPPEGVANEPIAEKVNQPNCASTDGGSIVITPQDEVEYSLDNTNWQSSNIFTNLESKSYFLYVRKLSNKDCVVKSINEIEILASGGELPDVPSLYGDQIQPTCSDPKGVIIVTKQDGVEFSIDKNNWQKSNVFIGISPGTYKVYARKIGSFNCISESEDIVISKPEGMPEKPTVEGEPIQPSCDTPTGTIVIKLQSGVEYSIDGVNWQSNNTIEGLATGEYQLYVRSLNDENCMAVSDDKVVIKAVTGGIVKPQLKVVPIQPSCSVPTGVIVIAEQPDVEYSLDGNNWQDNGVFPTVNPGDYFLYVRSKINTDCTATSDEKVTIKEVPNAPKEPVAENIVQPTCENPVGSFEIKDPEAGVEFSIDNKSWHTEATFTNVPEGEYILYARSKEHPDCITQSSSKVKFDTPSGAPQKPVINTVAEDDKINATEKEKGIEITGTAEDGVNVVVDFGGNTKTVVATGGVWSATYMNSEIPADGSVKLITTVKNASCKNQDIKTIIIDSVVPGDSDSDTLADDAGTLVVEITEDTDNDGHITSTELSGDIDYKITFPKNSGYTEGDKLKMTIGTTPLEFALTQNMIDAGYQASLPIALVQGMSSISIKAIVEDEAGNKSKEAEDSAILKSKNPGDSDGDGKPDQAGSIVITITEDVDNDGLITINELQGDVDYTITFPQNSGYDVGDILDIDIMVGAVSSTATVSITADILANGYTSSIANTFSSTTKIQILGSVKDNAGNQSLQSQDKAVVNFGSLGDSDGDGQPDDAGKPVVVITEDEDNNGFISVSELIGNINYTISFPKDCGYKAGDILVITTSIGVPNEVTLTDEMIEKGYNGEIIESLIDDNKLVEVKAIVKDKWDSKTLEGKDSAVLKRTTEDKDAPSITILEDADNDEYITAAELSGDIDYAVTFSSTGTYNVGDKLVVKPNKGDIVIVELTDDIIKNGYKGSLPASLFKDGDIVTVSAKITDSNGNESPVNQDKASLSTKVPGDADGDGIPDAEGAPVVEILEDVNNDGYIGVAELNGDIDYIIKLPKNCGYKVGDKLVINIGIVVPFKVKITEEILKNGYKGIVSTSWIKQGDLVKVSCKSITAKGDVESLEGLDIAIFDKAVPGDSDNDGVPDKFGIPEVIITEDTDDDGFINPTELNGDIDYTITFPLERNYTKGDTLLIQVNQREVEKIVLTDEIIKDGYVGVLPASEFENGDDIFIKARVKDPAGNESLDGSDRASLNKNTGKTPIIRIEEDVDNDGFINAQELQGDLDYIVLFPIKSNYKAGDNILITSNLGTEETITLTDETISNGYSATISEDKLPQSGEIVMTVKFVGEDGEMSDKAVLKTDAPGDSDKDGIADEAGAPQLTIIEDANDDLIIDKTELQGDIDYTVALPSESNYNVGDILYITPNKGGDKEIKLTEDIIKNGYKGTLPANLFADGDEVIIKAIVKDAVKNSSLTSEDKATISIRASLIPTVEEQKTDNSLPTIKGTVASETDIEVTVNGITYKEGDGNLSDIGDDTWELKIPVGNELSEGVYDVVVKATLASENKEFFDKTKDELIIDNDADDDGIPDAVEYGGNPASPVDTDGDGTPDYQDIDSDDDGIPDSVEAGGNTASPVDSDSDGMPDYRDVDSDNDTILDELEVGDNVNIPVDSDNDGKADYQDTDSDNDTILDEIEVGEDVTSPQDSDSDGIADFREVDSDDDTIPDSVEVGGNQQSPTDTDGDGLYDYQDIDSDDDTIPDSVEVGDDVQNPADSDSDGKPDYQDIDSDNDKIKDKNEVGRFPENPRDSDKDGVADFRSTDSDGDGMPDTQECGNDYENPIDTDLDGVYDYQDMDSDNDGIADKVEFGADPINPLDTDADGVYDYQDLDSDNDSFNDIIEAGSFDDDNNGMVDNENVLIEDNLPDGDQDGIPDYREVDSDNDGTPDLQERKDGDLSVDMDKDGIIDDKTDTDGDGILDPADGLVDEFGDAPGTIPEIDAVDDERIVFYGEQMESFSILENDTKDGNPIVSSQDDITVKILENNNNGAVKIQFKNGEPIVSLVDGGLPNKYTFRYRIAQKNNANNYDEASVTIDVQYRKIEAINDDYSYVEIMQGESNYAVGDVLENDLIGGESVDREKVVITLGDVTYDGKITYQPEVNINSLGIVSVSSSAEAGIYVLHYTICEKVFTANCSDATVKVIVNTDCKKLIDDMKIPQELSVNYDKRNDTWELPELKVYHEDCEDKSIDGISNKITIFNRWGMKVYEKSNYMLDDERFEGFSTSSLDFSDYSDMPSGVYYYIIQVKGLKDRTGYMYIMTERK